MLPTLNEIEGMKLIMPRVKREWVDEIVVIDGGSTDGTVEYAKEQGYRVIHQTTRGITRAYQEVLPHLKGDVVIAFSPDNNSVPERIPDLVTKMREGYDMVIVSRYLPGATSDDDDAVTAFGNWMFTKMINVFFGGSYTDSLVMMRAWRIELERDLPVRYPRAGIEPYLSIRCAKRKLKVGEIPGDEPLRVGSPRKMSPFFNGLDILRLIGSELLRRD
ncbi:MAG: glycosyltransferase [Elusimicrobia bacterium]|nr:glycosyltransferase [Elusimicrobiota bacterium]